MDTKKKKKSVLDIIFTVLGVVLCVIMIPIVAVNITLIIKSYTSPDQVPDFFGYKPFIVMSGSMEPTIMTGDLIVSKNINADDVKAGDVISYHLGDAVITHRVLEITADGNGARQFIMQGDNNNAKDEKPVTDEMIEGVYRLRLPGVGNFALFLQKPTGLILFVACPLVLFFLYDILRRKLSDKKDSGRTAELEAEIAKLRAEKEAEAKLQTAAGIDSGAEGKGNAGGAK